MRRRLYGAMLGGAMVFSLGATSFGETVWVKSANAVMREGKAAVYKAVANLQQGQALTVISRDSGWVQVDAGGPKGWVNEASVSTSKVNGALNIDVNAEMSAGAAARGLQPGAEDYVRLRHIDKAPLENLRSIAKSIQPDEWFAFIRDVHK